MANDTPLIVGAGLAGLLAAHAWPRATLMEREAAPREAHRAVLRFRSAAVSHLTGVPFRKVRVRKGIWWDGAFHAPNIRLANMYSLKCLGRVAADRSIWNIDSVDRWIAPDDLYAQLLDACSNRIIWNTRAPYDDPRRAVVSTAPLPSVLAKLGVKVADDTFMRAAISVARFEVAGLDAYQTIYFPGEETLLYRASATGSTLICEFAGEPDESAFSRGCGMARQAFGIASLELGANEITTQPLGKIEPLPDEHRKALLFKLTSQFNIFSLGRYATWRNILLDDVVDDITVIKRLMSSAKYDLRAHAAK